MFPEHYFKFVVLVVVFVKRKINRKRGVCTARSERKGVGDDVERREEVETPAYGQNGSAILAMAINRTPDRILIKSLIVRYIVERRILWCLERGKRKCTRNTPALFIGSYRRENDGEGVQRGSGWGLGSGGNTV